MDIIKASTLAVRFLVELGILAALGVWGLHTAQSVNGKISVGIRIPWWWRSSGVCS
jgi:hypothetical protein